MCTSTRIPIYMYVYYKICIATEQEISGECSSVVEFGMFRILLKPGSVCFRTNALYLVKFGAVE